jgi:hypothetical protein
VKANMPDSSAAKRGTGGILRLKSGFNPNSSSVGSEIPYFFAAAIGSGALVVMVTNLLAFYDHRIRRRRDELKK